MDGLSVSGLADLAGVTEVEVERLVELGILVARDGPGSFLETDVQKVRLAAACEQAGLPMEGIASAIRAGRLSFAFLETALYRRWAVRTGPTYQQVSRETGVPLELLASALEAMGFAPMTPEESITEDELEVVPLLQRGLASGLLDLAWFTRVGRAHAVGLRLIVTAGLVETAMGRHDDALGHLREARALAGRFDHAGLSAWSQVQLGILALVRGRLEEARALLDEGLELSLATRSTRNVTLCLTAFAQLAFVEGDGGRAALLAGAAEGLRQRVGLRAWPLQRQGETQMVAQIRQALDADRFDQGFAAGTRLNRREAVAAVRDQEGAGTHGRTRSD